MLAKFGDTTVEYRLRDSVYARVMNSIEVYGMDRQTWNEEGSLVPRFDSVPDVWRINPDKGGGKPDFVYMTEDIQHWIFRINTERFMGYRFKSEVEYRDWWRKLSKSGTNKSVFIQWWQQLFKGDRSHTNRAGVDTCWDFIGENNQGAQLPKFSNLVTGDYVGKVVQSTPRNVLGVPYIAFECINVSKKDYRNYHPFTHPHLFDQPIVTGRTLVKDKGGWTITGYWKRIFHHFDKKVVLPVMLPMDSEAWYPFGQVQYGGVPLGKT